MGDLIIISNQALMTNMVWWLIHYITQSPSDKKELLVTVKELNEILHKENYTIVVDYGYWHIKSLNEIYNSPTTIVIPDKASTSRTKEKKQWKERK